jgi:hypothetical protein
LEKVLEIIKKVFKYLGIIFLIGLFFIVTTFLYDKYEEYKEKKQELNYETKQNWNWNDEYHRIQISEVSSKDNLEEKMLLLRKVYMKDKYMIYAFKDSDYKLHSKVFFMVDCKPNSKIITTKQFSDKSEKILECDEKGKTLSYEVRWDGANRNIIWEENLDGFNFIENFANWDFSELDKFITLSKAK